MTPPPGPIKAPWDEVILVCRKCSRKLDGGFGAEGRQKLAKALKDELKLAGRRRQVRVTEVGCLSLCPKRAVTVVGSANPGQVWAVPAGADVQAVLEQVRCQERGRGSPPDRA